MKPIVALACSLLAAAATAAPGGSGSPASPPSAVLDSLAGHWEGTGMLMGRQAAFAMTWTPTDVPGVHTLAFSNAFVAEDGTRTPALGAHALYRAAADGTVSGVWFDTRGARIELEGVADAGRLRIEWAAPSEAGVTVYVWAGEGRVEVVDSVRAEGGMRQFGRAGYTRASR